MPVRARMMATALCAAAVAAPAAAWNPFARRMTRLGMATKEVQISSCKNPALDGERIAVGDMLPMDAAFKTLDEHGNIVELQAPEAFCGRRVVLVTMPAAFSPTCSAKHLPSYLRANNEGLFSRANVDALFVLTTDSPHVIYEWIKGVTNSLAAEAAESDEEAGEPVSLVHNTNSLAAVAAKSDEEAGEPVPVVLLSDPNALFCRCLGLKIDTLFGKVPKYSRNALLVQDGKVKVLLDEDGGSYSGKSGAENMLCEGLGSKDPALYVKLAEEMGLYETKKA